MEVIKPGHVALCILTSILYYPDEDDPTFSTVIQQRLRDILVKEVRRVDEVTHPSLVGLLDSIKGQLGDGEEGAEVAAQVQEHLGRHLAELAVPDDLLSLNRLVGDMITNSTSAAEEASAPGADCNAHLGFFLREIYTAFEFMPFEAVCKLLADCRQQLRGAAAVLPSWHLYAASEAPAPAGQRFAVPDGPEDQGRQGAALKTSVELERSLDERIQRAALEFGTAPRGALEAGLRGTGFAAQVQPKVLLARQQSALAHADLPASLDALHHYFDYAASKLQGDWLGKMTIDVAAARTQERGQLQSAALSLGMMHTQLGHIEEAMQALNETVRIAQQCSDDVCLCHALAALCHIMEATTPGAITSVAERRGAAAGATPAARHYAQLAQLLQRCLARSEELQLPHLVAFSRLSLARFHLLHPQATEGAGDAGMAVETSGAPVAPAAAALAVSDAVRDTAHLHLAAQLAAVVIQPLPMSTGRPASKLQRGIPELFSTGGPVFQNNTLGSRAACAAQVEQYAGAAHLLAAASWQLAGAPALALAHSLVVLDSYADVAPVEDQCTALAQLATGVAALHGYRAAEQVLTTADARFPHSQSKALRACRLAIAHDRALHRRELRQALEIGAQLAALASPTDVTSIDIRFEAEERHVRTLAAQGQPEAAAAAAQRLFSAAAEAGQTLPAVRLLVLLGRVHWGAGAPLLALPYLLSAAAHCRQLHLELLGAQVDVLLAQVWLSLGHVHAAHAQHQLEMALPLLIAHGGLAERVEALVAVAEVLLARHKSPTAVAAESSRVLQLLEDARAAAITLEDWDAAAHCHHLAALVWEACGKPEERNAEAAACLRLRQLEADGLH